MSTTRTNFKRFQRGWRILIIFIAAFAVGALIYSITSTPVFRAEAKFLVYPNDNITSSRDVVSSLDTLDKRTISTTYADILGSNRVFQDTVDRLQLDAVNLRDVVVQTEVQTDTNILVLSVEGPDPQTVTLLTNNIGQNGISYIKSIYQVFDISFLDLALEPQTPIRPRPLLYTLIAAGIGLAAGLIFLFLRDALRAPLESLRERSITDRQSLAFTRKYMLRSLVQELVKKGEQPLAFGLLYLQGLEDLIDGLPERVTNKVMQEVVEKLHDQLRGNDLVGRWERLEFAVLLPSTPEMPATKTFERLLQALEEPIHLESGESVPLTPVAGLVNRKAEDTGDTMTERAAGAIHTARSSGTTLFVAK